MIKINKDPGFSLRFESRYYYDKYLLLGKKKSQQILSRALWGFARRDVVCHFCILHPFLAVKFFTRQNRNELNPLPGVAMGHPALGGHFACKHARATVCKNLGSEDCTMATLLNQA
uniref:Uncharacterized protein n=1 Tax=Micrurus surinamensis TaxID=129470 RepID=A0A2D4NPA3_MICSU